MRPRVGWQRRIWPLAILAAVVITWWMLLWMAGWCTQNASPPPYGLVCLKKWAEKHSGLGGWVGAIGSIIAIIAAWMISRYEYMRDKRKEVERINKNIDLIIKITDD